MSWTQVQKSSATHITGTSGNASLTGVTAGNLLIVRAAAYLSGTNGAISAPTDSNGTLVNAINPFLYDGTINGSMGYGVWYILSAAAGTHTISFSGIPSGSDLWFTIEEYSFGSATYALDQKATNTTTVTSGFSASSGTTAALGASNDLSITGICIGTEGSGSTTMGITDPPTGYTSVFVNNNDSTDIGAEFSYSALSSSSAQNVSWSWTDNGNCPVAAGIVTFTPTSSSTYDLTAAQGSFSVTGESAGLAYNRVLPAATGTFTDTGEAATLIIGYAIDAAEGSFGLTGYAAALSGPSGTFNLAASTGSFVLTGENALRDLSVDVAMGSFVVNGEAATVGPGGTLSLNASVGYFSLTGEGANLLIQGAPTSGVRMLGCGKVGK